MTPIEVMRNKTSKNGSRPKQSQSISIQPQLTTSQYNCYLKNRQYQNNVMSMQPSTSIDPSNYSYLSPA